MEVVVVTYVEHSGDVGELVNNAYRGEESFMRKLEKALLKFPIQWHYLDIDPELYKGKDYETLTAEEYIEQGCIKFHKVKVV